MTAVGKILKDVDGVTGKCDAKASTITITAKDDATAQKALDALAAGGFHGDTGKKTLAQKDDSGVTKGKVKSLTLTGIHDCCGQCNGKIKAALKATNDSMRLQRPLLGEKHPHYLDNLGNQAASYSAGGASSRAFSRK